MDGVAIVEEEKFIPLPEYQRAASNDLFSAKKRSRSAVDSEYAAALPDRPRKRPSDQDSALPYVLTPDPTSGRQQKTKISLAEGCSLIHTLFRVGKEVGRGSLGKVVRAIPKGAPSSCAVAIKIIPTDMNSRAANEQAFMELLHTHPYGLCIRYGFAFVDSTIGLGIVMELASGGSLERMLRHQQFSARLVQHVLVDVTRALRHIHALDIIHMDVNPSNILVSSAAEEPFFFKLCDFGAAHQVGSTDELNSSGTGFYRSYEAAVLKIPAELITTAADLYSLGIILYELVTDYDFDTVPAATFANLSQAPPETRVAEMPLVCALYRELLHCEPSERPSASAICERTDLAEWFERREVPAAPPEIILPSDQQGSALETPAKKPKKGSLTGGIKKRLF